MYKLLEILLRLTDFILFIFAIPFGFVYFLIKKKSYQHAKCSNKNALFLVPGSGYNKSREKFDSYDQYQRFNPANYFNKLIFMSFSSGNSSGDDKNIKLKNNIYLKTFKSKKNFYYSGQLVYLNYLCTLIKNNEISLIRAFSPFHEGIIGFMLSKITNCPLCVSIHSDYDRRYLYDKRYGAPKMMGSRIIAKLIEKYVIKRAKMLLPVRESLAESLIKKGAGKESINVISHGLNLKLYESEYSFEILNKYNIDKNKKIICMAARFEKLNYIYDYIKICEKLSEIRKDWVFFMAGNGSEYNNIKDYIVKKQIEEFVQLPGYISHEDIINIRKAAYINVCLLGGYSLIEACASGNPVISYDVEWHYELIKNNKTGFLVNEGDIDDAVKKINYLFENPTICQSMGKNSKELVFERHSMENTSRKIISFYEQLLEKQ